MKNIVAAILVPNIATASLAFFAIKTLKQKNNQLKWTIDLTENLIQTICHDINNPLTIIKISNEDLNIDKLDQLPLLTKRISSSCSEIIRLTESLSSWLVFKNDLYAFNYSHIEIKKLTELLNIQFEEMLIKKNIKIRFEILNDAISFYADKVIISDLVFGNIISNAIKFSHNDSFIDISFSSEENNIIAKIRDYGVGINQKIINQVFSPYHKTSSKGIQGERGFGFGLPIAATLLEKLNGKISIENMSHIDPTQTGTLVTVTLLKS